MCERAFSPWTDMEAQLRARGLPLVSLESHRPLSAFDVVGVSLQYELSYSNVLLNLDLGGIPLRTEDRGDGDPIVIAGGPTATHPEPIAPFVDALLVGEAEEVLPPAAADGRGDAARGTAPVGNPGRACPAARGVRAVDVPGRGRRQDGDGGGRRAHRGGHRRRSARTGRSRLGPQPRRLPVSRSISGALRRGDLRSGRGRESPAAAPKAAGSARRGSSIARCGSAARTR